ELEAAASALLADEVEARSLQPAEARADCLYSECLNAPGGMRDLGHLASKFEGDGVMVCTLENLFTDDALLARDNIRDFIGCEAGRCFGKRVWHIAACVTITASCRFQLPWDSALRGWHG